MTIHALDRLNDIRRNRDVQRIYDIVRINLCIDCEDHFLVDERAIGIPQECSNGCDFRIQVLARMMATRPWMPEDFG